MVKTFADTVRYIQANATGTTGSGGELVYTRAWTDQSNYRLLPNSPAIGAGVAITGVHDQAAPATDADGAIVHFLPPSIGAYEPQGATKAVTANFSPTGYTVRGTDTEPAVINLGSDSLVVDLTGLTLDEAVTVKPGKKQVRGFVARGTKQYLKGSGGGGSGFGW